MNTVKTPKGTVLPLVNLKGKDYLMVGHRLQWFNETEANFTINTEFLLITDDQTVVKASVVVYDKDGKVAKSATATKRETKKDFSDHTEKAETSAIGRALAMLGYGTQFALSDLDEGDRLADSPMQSAKTNVVQMKAPTPPATESTVAAAPSESAIEALNATATKSKRKWNQPKVGAVSAPVNTTTTAAATQAVTNVQAYGEDW